MATTLKKTDVVIVGLGAVGGVAALPLRAPGSRLLRWRLGPG
jgi:choline dehydrogenase-like flavoprotein